jgi:hypothetical protein
MRVRSEFGMKITTVYRAVYSGMQWTSSPVRGESVLNRSHESRLYGLEKKLKVYTLYGQKGLTSKQCEGIVSVTGCFEINLRFGFEMVHQARRRPRYEQISKSFYSSLFVGWATRFE